MDGFPCNQSDVCVYYDPSELQLQLGAADKLHQPLCLISEFLHEMYVWV